MRRGLPRESLMFLATMSFVLGCLPQQAPITEVTVSANVLRPASKVPPIGANNWGRIGAVEYAANNFVQNSGNEPIHWRNLHRVTATGAGPNGTQWFEIDGGGVSWFDLWGSGFLSGAQVRVYRLLDAGANPIPETGGSPDSSKAESATLVGSTNIVKAGEKGFPDGGWIANRYVPVRGNTIRGATEVVDVGGLEPGRTYWYRIQTVNQKGEDTGLSAEVSVTAGSTEVGPVLGIMPNDNGVPLKKGQDIWWTPEVSGGKPPYRFSAVSALPKGISLNPENGQLSGRPESVTGDEKVTLKVTDSAGKSFTRTYGAQPPQLRQGALPGATGVKAAAFGNGVKLSWTAVAGAAGYRILRSTAPASAQENRAYVPAGAPKLRRWDYVVLEKDWENFPVSTVNARVRGIGNPIDRPNMPWRSEPATIRQSFAPHNVELPAEMIDPGKSCLRIQPDPAVSGVQNIHQFTMIAPDIAGEGLWYGQLEPGKRYRAEFWLRQEGLGNGGKVTFSFGNGYPGLRSDWQVTGKWQRFTYDFTAPERPKNVWHFGQRLEFSAPGTLWMDNARVFRVDDPSELTKPYSPNKTVLQELIDSQPSKGPKGTHRIWFLNRNATMDSILSWHANSNVQVDWYTQVSETMEMTLPMALMFDEQTGDSPETRMTPYLVLQHILHSEQDWANLVEYLAVPYDPAKDVPKGKPWAYRRYTQRGHGKPWTDTFRHIRIEFGNETWHNGAVTDDWLGFATRQAVTQGGPEYGMFTRHIVESMKRRPEWAALKLDNKIKFVLGAFYNGDIDDSGKVSGYGEEALVRNPHVDGLGHANYVGPKWETGDSSQKTYDDAGIQATLLSWVQGMEPSVKGWSKPWRKLNESGRVYDLLAYEGGPSGYALPGSAPADVVEVNERYGKSLAMAVAALDGWMGSYAYGYTDQAFLGYGQGAYWNSHTDFARGFRPTPGWLALKMRNKFASGDLMSLTVTGSPKVTRGKDSYDAIGAYAMRDGNKWSVILLSRRLTGDIPVRIKLPVSGALQVTEHRLAGDPRATNRESMKVQIVSKDLGSVNGYLQVTVPAGSIAILQAQIR